MLQKSQWLDKMRCTLIAERNTSASICEGAIEAALSAGVRAVHIREKQATTRELYELAMRARSLTQRHEALLIINDRVDVALAVGADGVHLGWQSLPAEDARRVAGRKMLIGRSVHNLYEAQQAAKSGYHDYLFASPVFDTPSKAGLVPTLGLARLAEICRAVDLPVIGLGGIDATNAATVIEAGAVGVAVIRAILAAADPSAAAKKLLEALR